MPLSTISAMAAPPWVAGKPTFAQALQQPHQSETPPLPMLHPHFNFKGELAVLYPEDEIDILAAPFAKALVGKFSRGRPTMEFLRNQIKTIGFKGEVQLAAMDSRHVRMTFDIDEDYHRCWLKRTWSLGGAIMRIIKWTKNFDYDEESALAPVWLTVEFPPVYFFHPKAIADLGNSLGELLFADAPTKNLTRPSTIRLCVEMDVSKPKPNKIRLGSIAHNKSYAIYYEDFPQYCNKCFKLGHSDYHCKRDLDGSSHFDLAGLGTQIVRTVADPKHPETARSKEIRQPVFKTRERTKPPTKTYQPKQNHTSQKMISPDPPVPVQVVETPVAPTRSTALEESSSEHQNNQQGTVVPLQAMEITAFQNRFAVLEEIITKNKNDQQVLPQCPTHSLDLSTNHGSPEIPHLKQNMELKEISLEVNLIEDQDAEGLETRGFNTAPSSPIKKSILSTSFSDDNICSKVNDPVNSSFFTHDCFPGPQANEKIADIEILQDKGSQESTALNIESIDKDLQLHPSQSAKQKGEHTQTPIPKRSSRLALKTQVSNDS